MAIPFSLPSEDTTLEQYRTIHQLLLDLTDVLRTLVARNPEWTRSAAECAATATTTSTNSAAHLSNPNNTNNPMVVSPAAPAIPIGASHSVSPLLSPTSHFRLPLSPPNSQPGSPSPFFTSTAASVFVLPDVVCNAARTLNEMPPSLSPLLQLQQQHQIQPINLDCATLAPTTTHAAATVANAAASNTGTTPESQIGLASRKLRKRKRIRLLSNKKMWQNNEVIDSCIYKKQQQHKITKTTHNEMICSCFCSHAATSILATAVEVDHHQHQQQETGMRSKARFTQPMRQTQKSTCDNNYSYSHNHWSDEDDHQANFRAVRMLTNDCYCIQQLPSDSDYKIPVCMHVGEELRKILECFSNPRKMNGCISCADDITNIKSTSFLSQFGRTVFTAALLVIGWKLLKQN